MTKTTIKMVVEPTNLEIRLRVRTVTMTIRKTKMTRATLMMTAIRIRMGMMKKMTTKRT